jgi:NAD(P)-dependent dehydrogenase (short-subunit alcohol dehydrogenase family)
MTAGAEPLRSQTGIVTGAARGIGLAIARRLAAAGMRVALVDVDAERVEGAARLLRDEGLSAEGHATDLLAAAALGGLLERLGGAHALVNNAGVYPYVPFGSLDLDVWRRIMQTNVDSAFLCARAVAPRMRAAGYGRIVNISSSVMFNGVGGAAYVASKAALIGLTRALALELGADGITVNAVAPGLVETEGVLELGTRADELFAGSVAEQIVKRRGRPEDIAEAVAYLVAPAASFITGQLIAVNGGADFN